MMLILVQLNWSPLHSRSLRQMSRRSWSALSCCYCLAAGATEPYPNHGQEHGPLNLLASGVQVRPILSSKSQQGSSSRGYRLLKSQSTCEVATDDPPCREPNSGGVGGIHLKESWAWMWFQIPAGGLWRSWLHRHHLACCAYTSPANTPLTSCGTSASRLTTAEMSQRQVHTCPFFVSTFIFL